MGLITDNREFIRIMDNGLSKNVVPLCGARHNAREESMGLIIDYN